jgi:hypothetical protein
MASLHMLRQSEPKGSLGDLIIPRKEAVELFRYVVREDIGARARVDPLSKKTGASLLERSGNDSFRAHFDGGLSNQHRRTMLTISQKSSGRVQERFKQRTNFDYRGAGHMTRKPLVEIIKKGQVIPFDVAATRVLQLDDPDLDNVATLKEKVKTAIIAAEIKANDADNPITVAIDIQALAKSGKPVERELGTIMTMLAELQAQVATIQQNTQPSLLAALAGFAPTRGGMAVGMGDTSLNPAGASYFDTATALQVLRTLAAEYVAEKTKTDPKPEKTDGPTR